MDVIERQEPRDKHLGSIQRQTHVNGSGQCTYSTGKHVMGSDAPLRVDMVKSMGCINGMLAVNSNQYFVDTQ